MISGDGHTLYVSGDTDIMSDTEWMGDYHKPDIGILCAGGHFTMDMARAAYAAKRYFDFKTVIPCHYRTFPILEQSAKDLADGLPGVTVIEPEVLQEIEVGDAAADELDAVAHTPFGLEQQQRRVVRHALDQHVGAVSCRRDDRRVRLVGRADESTGVVEWSTVTNVAGHQALDPRGVVEVEVADPVEHVDE